jgi:cytochrome c6
LGQIGGSEWTQKRHRCAARLEQSLVDISSPDLFWRKLVVRKPFVRDSLLRHPFLRNPLSCLCVLLLAAWLLLSPAAQPVLAAVVPVEGGQLFEAHCAGCHIHGGNIIRRGKTLKLAALERQGVASPQAIALIAAAGVGQMGGYGGVLGEEGVQAVADWVWAQAQAGWPSA